jgi:hypothetical protein
MGIAGEHSDTIAWSDTSLRQAGREPVAQFIQFGICPRDVAALDGQFAWRATRRALQQIAKSLSSNDGFHIRLPSMILR